MNIIMGERYKVFPKESKAMLRGEYGKLPGEVNEEVRAKAAKAMDEAHAEAERTRKALHGELAAHDKAMTEREAAADKAVRDAKATVAKAYGLVKGVLDAFDEA